jgi:hypothetical protein
MGVETCVVASKVAMSLQAQLQEKVTEERRHGPHTWTEDRWRFFGEIYYTIRGTSAARGQLPQGYIPPDIVNAAALSVLPKAFMETWLLQNKDHAAVKNGLIYIAKDRRYAGDKAKEIEKLKSGFEPLIPNDMDPHTGRLTVMDPRWPKARAVPVVHFGAGQAPEVSVGADPDPGSVQVS